MVCFFSLSKLRELSGDLVEYARAASEVGWDGVWV